MDHTAFAEQIAPVYDEIYNENSHYASKSYMNFEELALEKLMQMINDSERNYALDLGSGTGRLSIKLSSLFKKVDAFDISSSMIKCAFDKKTELLLKNVDFYTHDLNKGIPVNDSSSDLIYCSFGLGSFVGDIYFFCNEINRCLNVNGKALISFYNRNALLYELDKYPWVPSLSATLDNERNAINVKINGNICSVFARSYTVKEVAGILKEFFNLISITTFPTISSFLPDELLNNSNLRNLCGDLDLYLSDNNSDSGAYILAIVEKRT